MGNTKKYKSYKKINDFDFFPENYKFPANFFFLGREKFNLQLEKFVTRYQ